MDYWFSDFKSNIGEKNVAKDCPTLSKKVLIKVSVVGVVRRVQTSDINHCKTAHTPFGR
jgi:hypothetical protein